MGLVYHGQMLALVEISKSFAGQTLIPRQSLTVPAGSTTVLLGPSGCGKSTLLRIIVGLVKPDTGAVIIAGEALTDANVLSLRRRMGYVIQEGGLFPHLTCYDNAALMARYLKWPEIRVRCRIEELAELTQFPSQCLGRYPRQVSGGQRQRVGLIRALMLDPDVLLLDEPLGALDPLVRHDLQGDLKRIFRSLEKTVVIVTHDIGEAAFLGDTIVMLRDGRILQVGTFDELAYQPADPFVSRFLAAQRVPSLPPTPVLGLCAEPVGHGAWPC